MFMHFVGLKDFKSCRCYLVDHFVRKFLKYEIEELKSDETKEYILTIMKNLPKYKNSNMNVNDRKVAAIQKVLTHVLDPKNDEEFRSDSPDIPVCARTRSSTTSFNTTDYSGMGSGSSSASSSKPSNRVSALPKTSSKSSTNVRTVPTACAPPPSGIAATAASVRTASQSPSARTITTATSMC
jgi:hypothetical protein